MATISNGPSSLRLISVQLSPRALAERLPQHTELGITHDLEDLVAQIVEKISGLDALSIQGMNS